MVNKKAALSTDEICEMRDLPSYATMFDFVLGSETATLKETFFELEEVTCKILIKRLYQTDFAYGK